MIGVHRTWLTSNIRPGVIWSNTQSYSNPKVTSCSAPPARRMDLPKRKAAYKEAQKLIVDDCRSPSSTRWTFHEGYLARVQQPPHGIWGGTDALLDTSMKADGVVVPFRQGQRRLTSRRSLTRMRHLRVVLQRLALAFGLVLAVLAVNFTLITRRRAIRRR